MGEPARNYSWPPFEEGHTLSMRHGARSERVVRPLAEAAAAQLLEVAPWCAVPAFKPTVDRWAWALARATLLRHWIDEHGILDAEGAPQPALSELARAEATEAKASEALGLSPRDWARVMAATRVAESAGVPGAGAQVEALAAVGRELVERAGELEVGEGER